jgi:DNA repair photolyase
MKNGESTRATMNGKPVFTVPANSVLNLDSQFKEKLLCSGPTFSAGTACVFSCAFCYVPAMTLKQRPWLTGHGVEGKHEDVVIRRAGTVDVLDRQLHKPKARALWKEPLTIFSSPAVDVAGNMELVRETVEICKAILELTNWDIRLLSKSHLLPKVAEGLSQSRLTSAAIRVIYGVSTGTLDDKLAAAIEDGTPLVSKRIESLHWLQDNGFRTFGMICPSLPQWMPGLSAYEAYRDWAIKMAAAIRADRCEHVWAEVINLRGESFTRTILALSQSGFGAMANELTRISNDKQEWEQYARTTFCAHAEAYAGQAGPDEKPKLRFLQYVTKSTRDWWENQKNDGAVVLGAAATPEPAPA